MSDSESVKAAAYRLHAAHCADLAQGTSDRKGRATLLVMSLAWLRLAELVGKNSKSQLPVVVLAGRRNPIPMITTRSPRKGRDTRSPLPAALVRRGTSRLLCCPRPQRQNRGGGGRRWLVLPRALL
jgi:hypothetical protein